MNTPIKLKGIYDQAPDAYEHMTWYVGFGDEDEDNNHGDWTAFADLVISQDRQYVRYHVVVNSESGSFIDTVVDEELTLEEARQQLPDLLYFWADVAAEQLKTDGAWFTDADHNRNLAHCKSWKNMCLKELQP